MATAKELTLAYLRTVAAIRRGQMERCRELANRQEMPLADFEEMALAALKAELDVALAELET